MRQFQLWIICTVDDTTQRFALGDFPVSKWQLLALLPPASGQPIYFGAADGAAFFFVSQGIGGTSSSMLHCST